MHPIFLFLHLVGVVIWVGGMFFAWVASCILALVVSDCLQQNRVAVFQIQAGVQAF
jgi:uncharacterized membrane protein